MTVLPAAALLPRYETRKQTIIFHKIHMPVTGFL